MAPCPVTSAIVKVVFALMRTDGETFQPWPRSRAALAPVPSTAMPALPFSPVKLSGLIERVFAGDRRDRLPRPSPRPSKAGWATRGVAAEQGGEGKREVERVLHGVLLRAAGVGRAGQAYSHPVLCYPDGLRP